MASYLLQEDNSSRFILEDGTGDVILEAGTDAFAVSLAGTSSLTATLRELHRQTVAFAGSSSLRAGFLERLGGGFNPISEDFLGNPAEFEQGLGQSYDDFTLPDLTSPPPAVGLAGRSSLAATLGQKRHLSVALAGTSSLTADVHGRLNIAGGFNPISEDFLGNPAEFEQGLGQSYDDFTLPDLTAKPTPVSIAGTSSLAATVGGVTLRFSIGLAGRSSLTASVGLRRHLAVTFAGTSSFIVHGLRDRIQLPFIGSTSTVYGLELPPQPPFIGSRTRVYDLFSLFNPNWTGSGPGNGGETLVVRLNANGATATATLATGIDAASVYLTLTGYGGLPTDAAFVVTIDAEQLLLIPQSGGTYAIRSRGLGNTTPASHSAGATASWGDSYDLAIVAAFDIAHDFTADIAGSGSFTYPGWLVCFDSTQAYLAGSRYPMHVTSLVGVFDAGAGSSGTSRLDASQSNAISTPTGVSDDCPAALSTPARIATDVAAGDVAVVRYTNPEAATLDLGPRSVALQSWFGLKRVSTVDADVTFTDPNGIVVDTTGTYDTYTGSINGEWHNPSVIGIAPATGEPTPGPEPYTSVTLPGSDRYFTHGSPGYNEKGWPFGVLAVRQGNRRVPFWQSYDWHNFSYVYCGFGTDDTFAQIVVNRNGISGAEPEVVLPGPQDISGPDAVWDDGSYYFAASWYVAIFSGPYLVIGPTVGGTPPEFVPGPPVYIPTVTFPPGEPPVITPPSPPPPLPVEGGSGGGISPPPGDLHVWTRL
jgi:hypothetical protein